MRMLKIAAFLSFASWATGPAYAQDFQVVDMGVLTNTLSIDHVTQSEDRRAAKGRRSSFSGNIMNQTRSSGSQAYAAQKSVTLATSASLTFAPSLTQRRKNYATFVSKTRAQSPESAAQLEQMLASTDVISALGSVMAPYGLRTTNVADAYAVYWIAAWEASRSIVSTTETRQRVQAVKAQAASALLATPEFTLATPAQKQELAEALLIQSALIQSSVQKYSSDKAMLSKVAAAVIQGARAMGLDLSTMTLTPTGFKSTTNIGAAEGQALPITPDIPPEQLAATPPAANEDSTTNYALIAAAGGAGIAGVFFAGKMMGKKG